MATDGANDDSQWDFLWNDYLWSILWNPQIQCAGTRQILYAITDSYYDSIKSI